MILDYYIDVESLLKKAHKEKKPIIIPTIVEKPSLKYIGFYVYHPGGNEEAHRLADKFLEFLERELKADPHPVIEPTMLETTRWEKEVAGVRTVFVMASERMPVETVKGGGFHWLLAKARRFMREKGI